MTPYKSTFRNFTFAHHIFLHIPLATYYWYNVIQIGVSIYFFHMKFLQNNTVFSINYPTRVAMHYHLCHKSRTYTFGTIVYHTIFVEFYNILMNLFNKFWLLIEKNPDQIYFEYFLVFDLCKLLLITSSKKGAWHRKKKKSILNLNYN